MIIFEEVRKFFHYDPDTGVFTRIKRIKPDPTGKTYELRDCNWVLNKPSAGGYIHARFHGKYVGIHRLIWVWMEGSNCKNQIDHIDGNRLNNKWSNLREVTPTGNCCNRGIRSDNSTGIVGVSKYRDGIRYIAQIQKNGVKIHLGVYDTLHEAAIVRKQAENINGFHPNHGRRPSWGN